MVWIEFNNQNIFIFMFNASSLSWLRIRVKCAHMWKMYKCINVWEATYALLTPYWFKQITWIWLIIKFKRRKPVRSINWFQLYSPQNWVTLSRETACAPLSGPVLLVRGGLWRWQPVASGDLIKCGCPPAGVLALHWGQWTGAVLWHVIGLRGLPGEVQLALGAA